MTVNPELIGGARITVGDTVIDGSVQAKLAAMATPAASREPTLSESDRNRGRSPTIAVDDRDNEDAQLCEETMQLNPSEISELIKLKNPEPGYGAEVRTQGTVVSVTDGICRVHGLSDAMQGEMLEFPRTRSGSRSNLERDSVGAVILRRIRAHHRRRHRQVHGPHSRSAGRPRADRPRRQLARPADRRQGSDQREGIRRHREGRAGRDLAQDRCRSRCRPGSRRSTRWCRSAAASAS